MLRLSSILLSRLWSRLLPTLSLSSKLHHLAHLLCQFLIFFLLAKQNDNSRYGERFEDEDMEQMMKDADLDRLVVLSFLIFHFEKEFLFLLSYSERLVVLTF